MKIEMSFEKIMSQSLTSPFFYYFLNSAMDNEHGDQNSISWAISYFIMYRAIIVKYK